WQQHSSWPQLTF
nr:immunoglobulin light chain junction region [Macaca mulatta]MPO01819.1 immunoglobulin light chain junction region [Macaca mulatta]